MFYFVFFFFNQTRKSWTVHVLGHWQFSKCCVSPIFWFSRLKVYMSLVFSPSNNSFLTRLLFAIVVWEICLFSFYVVRLCQTMCVCTPQACRCPQKSIEGTRSPELELCDVASYHVGVGKLHPSLLEEQPVLSRLALCSPDFLFFLLS